MSEPKIDYTKLGFAYHKTNANYLSYYRDGAWDEGVLRSDSNITISAFSTCLHYGQEAFEGLKAYRRKDGRIQLFRPEENAKRFERSCRKVLIPVVPLEKFMKAIEDVVRANEEFVPPYGSNATLYLRPYAIGVGENLGVRPAREYIFGVICSPVGSYFPGGLKPINFLVTDIDRAAPNGTGDVKVGGNYGASLYPHEDAKDRGFADCIYLDPTTHTKIDEVGAANFFGITNDNKFVTPVSSSILCSVTKMSLLYIAKNYLGMVTEEREVFVDKLGELKEAGACGTAAVIAPIGGIEYNGKLHVFHSLTEVGPITKKLYDTLIGIQFGDLAAPEGWIHIL